MSACPHCKSSGRACAYCNPDHEVPMSEIETAPPRPRRHRPTQEELVAGERASDPRREAPMPTTPPENVPGPRVLARLTESLRCKLTRLEVEEQRVEMQRILDEIDGIDLELASVKATLKARRERAMERLRECRRAAADATITRDVEVWAMIDGRRVRYVRIDTQETLRERDASQAELQEPMFG